VPAVFSTHEPTPNAVGSPLADGYHNIQGDLNNMLTMLPTDHQDWHDGVWLVPQDLGVTWVGGPNQGHITKSGVPLVLALFAKPGTGDDSAHVAKAIQHLVDLCVNHPEQGPKEMF
jgi:hypothetical protein